MFELTKTYTCNGCSAVATESKAKKWTHLDNSPENGKQNMDFCPKCSEMLSSIFTATINSTAESKQSESAPVAEQPTVESEVEILSVTDDTTAETEPVVEIPEQYLAFYTQLYSRVLFAVACDDSLDNIKMYIKFIPGVLSINTNTKNTDSSFTLNCNGKHLNISRDRETGASTEITIRHNNKIVVTRKVSRYPAIQALITDTSASAAASLLPYDKTCYTDIYLRECLVNIDEAIEDVVQLREIREWFTYAAMQTGIELT